MLISSIFASVDNDRKQVRMYVIFGRSCIFLKQCQRLVTITMLILTLWLSLNASWDELNRIKYICSTCLGREYKYVTKYRISFEWGFGERVKFASLFGQGSTRTFSLLFRILLTFIFVPITNFFKLTSTEPCLRSGFFTGCCPENISVSCTQQLYLWMEEMRKGIYVKVYLYGRTCFWSPYC